jgi:hypothetical protein
MKHDDWVGGNPPNNWFDEQQIMKELFDLKFAIHALADTSGTPGSMQREIARNASIGLGHRIDYLHDSITRWMGKK